ncbi:thioesterase II family protein [Actinomadura rugatobispora]|uniref:Thioesterase II family protein n=1 Tax=Actinomadura rugatobispora TaxID=1994 RepID=A0ABW1ACE2_9ACTN|nr:alpha/beta fold hydrolase [Actinomadura rugatobispora]
MPDFVVDSAAWIRRFHPAPDAGTRLVCFPHAGGSASFYHPVSAALAPGIEVLTVQYPGRQDRRAEQPITDIGELADGVFAALRPWLDGGPPSGGDRKVALFGHSMGAIVAFEVARRMEREFRAPSLLVASGRRAPSRYRQEAVHRRDDAGIIAEITRLSGTDPRLLDETEMLRAALPAIRGDYQAVETYVSDPGAALACPVTVFVGDDDPMVTLEEANAWRGHTTAGFDLHVFKGGHFYLTSQPAATIERLAELCF